MTAIKRILFLAYALASFIYAQDGAADSAGMKTPAPVSAADSTGKADTLDYWANKVEYSVKDSTILLSGNAKIIYGSVHLTADTIVYYTNLKSMIALGNPILIDGADTLRGDYIAYNTEKRSGKVKYGLMYSTGNTSYYAENIARADSSIYGYHGLYTTCMFPDRPHSHFYCEKIKVLPNDKTVVKPFVLVVGDAPMLALPYFIIPLEKDRTSGWLPIRWGVTLNGSGDVDNVGYYWVVNDYLDFMLAGRVDNFENFQVKGEARYALKNVITGNVYSDYVVNDMYMGSQNRWSLNFNHDQNLLPDRSFTLRGSGSMVSDKRYFSDFSDDTLSLTNQNLSSNLSLSKRFDDIGGYASLTWQRSQNIQRETVEQDAPTINFTLNSRPLVPLKVEDGDTSMNPLSKLSWSYSYKGNQKILERTKIDSSYHYIQRGMSHSIPISMPFNVLRHIKVTPSFTVNQSLFDSYRDTAAIIDTVIKQIFDTIPASIGADGKVVFPVEINDARYNGKAKDTLYIPNRLAPDTVLVRVYMDSTLQYERRYDTTYYHEDAYDLRKAHQVWWNTGVNLSTDIYGIWGVKLGKMQGIRHTLSPTVGYRLTPKKDLDVIFPSIGVSSPSGTKRRQEITFGVNNLFETKILSAPKDDTTKASEKKINLLTANASGSYNFEADSQKLSDISLTATVPAPKVNMSYSGSYHPYDMRNNFDMPKPLSHTISVTPQLPSLQGNIWSGDLILHEGLETYGYLDEVFRNNSRDWSITVTPRYTYSLTRQDVASDFKANKNYNMGAGLSFMLSQRWRITWSGTWSFTENTFINQSVALYADLECWDLKLDWYPSGVNEGRIYFVAALKKHRDLKWEQREN